MLNHAIDNLTTAQEDVFLTTRLIGFVRSDYKGRVCFLGALDLVVADQSAFVARNYQHFPSALGTYHHDGLLAQRFNALCVKLETGARVRYYSAPPTSVPFAIPTACENGAARVGVLIRNRILSNRARRTLQNRPVVNHPVQHPESVVA